MELGCALIGASAMLRPLTGHVRASYVRPSCVRPSVVRQSLGNGLDVALGDVALGGCRIGFSLNQLAPPCMAWRLVV